MNDRLEQLLAQLQLPADEVLFLHVRLKGLDDSREYPVLFRDLIDGIVSSSSPRTLLIPTFTYSFTRKGIYDRSATLPELGRFNLEAFFHYGAQQRSMNPVFSFIDTGSYFRGNPIDELTAFGPKSFFECISNHGYLTVNINICPEEIRLTPLHYLEFVCRVPYRYLKYFNGEVSENGRDFRRVQFEYFVRDLARDPRWNRPKLFAFLTQTGQFHAIQANGIHASWMHSQAMEYHVEKALRQDPEFLIK